MDSLKQVPSIQTIAKNKKTSIAKIKRQLAIGSSIEKEHTNNKETARKIAKAHVDEFPNYYTALRKMESKLKNEVI